MTLVPSQAGLALASAAEEALRLWRAARRHGRRDRFPGLVDDLVEPFARAVGETLSAGAPPEEAWRALAGVVRAPREGAAAEVEAEWVLAGEVLAAIADALKAEPAARHHAVAAAREAWRRTVELVAASPPARGPVVVVRVLTGGRPRK